MAEGGHWRDESDHERDPRHSSLDSRQSQVLMEHASVEACTVMTWLGYGPHVRQARRDAYRERDKRSQESQSLLTCVTTGSKAEGLTSIMESDRDLLFVDNAVMCLENHAHCDTLPRNTTVFTLNTDMCYHGHCRLLLERIGTRISPFVRKALCYYENGRVLLSSDLYVNSFDGIYTHPEIVHHDRAGPSTPKTYRGVANYDVVHSFHCHCPSILHRWAQRRRYWPPPEVVQEVVKMGAFVTPVGFKESEYKHIEWRICFNTGENMLIQRLHNTQVYVYVILKMIVKVVLKPLNKEFTPYTVKNIVLWLAEKYPESWFNEQTMLHWVREGLRELRTAILTKHLPYYMIPARNLMSGCGIDDEQGRNWVSALTHMIDEGQNMLLRIPHIRQAIISHPDPVLWFCKKRVELELLQLNLMIRLQQFKDENGLVNFSHPMLQAIAIRRAEILTDVHQRMCRNGCRVHSLTDIFERMLM